MAEEKDNDTEKTEEPTAHRLEEAFRKGNVAFSREITHWFILGMAALLLAVLAPYLARQFVFQFTFYIGQPDQFIIDGDNAVPLLKHISLQYVLLIIPMLGFFMAAAIAAALLQTRMAVSFQALKPQFKRLSPLAGFKRIFAKKAMVEFLKGLLKLSVVAFALYAFLVGKIDDIPGFITLVPGQVLPLISKYVLQVIFVVVGSLTLIAILDYLYQKYEFIKSLRMTKDEVKREYKTQEGDPQIKYRRRQMAQQRIKTNLKEALGRTTAIITNPTHYAVAISYFPETMDAPVVVAKGINFVALKIRELGQELKVPVVENPPLARALYASVEVEQEIPPEHYKAVADVIRFVMMLKKQPF